METKHLEKGLTYYNVMLVFAIIIDLIRFSSNMLRGF